MAEQRTPHEHEDNATAVDAIREDLTSYDKDELIELLLSTYSQEEIDEAYAELTGE